jgi:DNA (cytosine-5)-methyltransferase 1
MAGLYSIEICAGAGGQALGLEDAKFKHVAVMENDRDALATLRENRPDWNILDFDITEDYVTLYLMKGKFKGIDLFAGGVPCPPFSMAGKQLGAEDERDLFPRALELIDMCNPKAIMLENVRGLLETKFDEYRENLQVKLNKMGYYGEWKLFHASDFGVPQLRPRAILVALKKDYTEYFEWPGQRQKKKQVSVGEALHKEMGSDGWKKVDKWRKQANKVAPTLVGGSKKHGGPDLGPTRAKKAWAELGVNAHTIAEDPPEPDFDGMPRLTVRMASMIQGFDPDRWLFTGKKTAAYRQVGNAFPPPVANAVGEQIRKALRKGKK